MYSPHGHPMYSPHGFVDYPIVSHPMPSPHGHPMPSPHGHPMYSPRGFVDYPIVSHPMPSPRGHPMPSPHGYPMPSPRGFVGYPMPSPHSHPMPSPLGHPMSFPSPIYTNPFDEGQGMQTPQSSENPTNASSLVPETIARITELENKFNAFLQKNKKGYKKTNAHEALREPEAKFVTPGPHMDELKKTHPVFEVLGNGGAVVIGNVDPKLCLLPQRIHIKIPHAVQISRRPLVECYCVPGTPKMKPFIKSFQQSGTTDYFMITLQHSNGHCSELIEFFKWLDQEGFQPSWFRKNWRIRT